MIEQRWTDVHYAVKKPPQWVINDTVPVGVVLLAGPPKKSYKSTLAIIEACLAARWNTTALPPWMACDLGGPTMLVSCEATDGEVLWLIEEGLKVKTQTNTIYVAMDSWQFQLDIEEHMAAFLADLDERKPRLIIIDPFRNVWSGDENDSGAIIKVLGPLRAWAHANEAAIIIVHHINKPPSDVTKNANGGGMYSMRGSSAIPGLADGMIIIEPTNTEGQITINTTFKRGTSWRRTIQLGVPGFGWPEQGYEVQHEQALALRELWAHHKGNRDANFMVQACTDMKVTAGTLRVHVESLLRNTLIHPLTPAERALFLAGAP